MFTVFRFGRIQWKHFHDFDKKVLLKILKSMTDADSLRWNWPLFRSDYHNLLPNSATLRIGMGSIIIEHCSNNKKKLWTGGLLQNIWSTEMTWFSLNDRKNIRLKATKQRAKTWKHSILYNYWKTTWRTVEYFQIVFFPNLLLYRFIPLGFASFNR